MMMRIAFLYIAEAYQVYHSASVALELSRREDCTVEIFYSDAETPDHIERIRKAWDGSQLVMHRLSRSAAVRAVQSVRLFGFWKEQVMRENAALLNQYEVVVCTESTDTYLRKAGMDQPQLVFIPHGAGDREVGFLPETAIFDFVTPPGEKCAARMLQQELIREGHFAVPGYIKFEVAERLARHSGPIFGNGNQTVLYNAHRAAKFSSWSKFIEPMMDYFGAQEKLNLIVAPHVKMFHRLPDRVREKWRNKSTGNILVDTGSWSCVDMTYTTAASIYIGDVSSQVYEFLANPRPCIFLNAQKIAWKDDPNYAHWHLGDVIEDPQQLPGAIESALAHHPKYVDVQKQKTAMALGDISPGATKRAADAIHAYMRKVRP